MPDNRENRALFRMLPHPYPQVFNIFLSRPLLCRKSHYKRKRRLHVLQSQPNSSHITSKAVKWQPTFRESKIYTGSFTLHLFAHHLGPLPKSREFMSIKGKEPGDLGIFKYLWFQIQTCCLLGKVNRHASNFRNPSQSPLPYTTTTTTYEITHGG